MSTPGGRPPDHLPQAIRGMGCYWIFFCRTREAYRGRGLYGAVLRHLTSRARRQGGGGQPIYIDTEAGNYSAQRGVLSSGFVPKGMFTLYYLRLPKIQKVLFYRWQADCPHPQPAERIAGGQRDIAE